MMREPCRCVNGLGCVPCRVWGKWRGRPSLAERLSEASLMDLSRLAFEDELRAEISLMLRQASAQFNPPDLHVRAEQAREYRRQRALRVDSLPPCPTPQSSTSTVSLPRKARNASSERKGGERS